MADLSSNPNSNNAENHLNHPKARFMDAMDIIQWEGFWFEPGLVQPAMTFRSCFQAQNNDVVLTSNIKTGTTWLKSLCLCILKNPKPDEDLDLLVEDNPHFHVPTIESTIYSTKPHIDLYKAPSPRLLHSHLPYIVLPDSVKNTDCKIVYIARNPKDTLISMWHFFNSILYPNQDPFPLERTVDCFLSGVHQYGPFFDHVLQYWLESRKNPQKILFLKYEELKRDPKGEVKKLAEFLGKPFATEEEIDKVLWRCSLERLKNLKVNKNGSIVYSVPNSLYFRKGVVGDWKNYLTPEMEEKINQMSSIKLEEHGLFL
ncbi:cytosolic sulfotransferase 5-like [Olea europaea var. sylvestris]|uniref:Sulfotransferase n=1 Tax=Olea europaea subsp. europaea TaxID=158383 RepID=A0A8S0RTA4_OLEEU|nr:cytosolic sulfotransferase 5-like [Olea europaea var. sylvestris]CAA2982526.1 cytosolic sulfotransferase 5-like [Olea europaea subsp. europaea]